MNNIMPKTGNPIWSCIFKTTTPKTVESIEKIDYPKSIIDNSTELSAKYHDRTTVLIDSASALLSFLTANNIDLNGKTIPE